ncbi:hypothetical protein FQZ97_460300 [compost metagenome]
MQLEHADDQDHHRQQQGCALDALLPALAPFALFLELQYEVLQLADEGFGLLRERHAVTPFEGWQQVFPPLPLNVVEGDAEWVVSFFADHLFQRFAVQAALHVVTKAGDGLRGGIGLQLPVQAISRHAQRAGGVDGCRIILADQGDEYRAERAGESQHRDQYHREPGPGRQ